MRTMPSECLSMLEKLGADIEFFFNGQVLRRGSDEQIFDSVTSDRRVFRPGSMVFRQSNKSNVQEVGFWKILTRPPVPSRVPDHVPNSGIPHKSMIRLE